MIDEDEFGFAVAEEDGDGSSVEAEIDGIKDGTNHRNGEVEFVHGRSVGSDDGDDVASLDANGREGRGELKASTMGFRPGVSGGVVDDRGRIAINEGGSFDEADWSEGRGISRAWLQSFHRNCLCSVILLLLNFLPLQV